MRRELGIVLISLVCFQGLLAQKTPFSRGVNLTQWFQVNGPREIQFTQFTRKDFEQIKSLGADAIRLPINLHAMTEGPPNYRPDPLFLSFLDQVVDWAEELELHLILDNHTFNVEEDTDPQIGRILEKVWPQMAEHYRDRSEFLYYEVLNEPHGISDELWNTIQLGVVDAIRAVDTTHYIVIGGADWNSYNSLNAMPEYADDKLIYTFHFYDPFLFTHQGATWVSPSLAPMAEVPFPYEASRMPSLDPSFIGSWIQFAYNGYPQEGSVGRVQQLLQIARQFREERKVPIYCGELGVFIPNSDAEDRNFWYQAVIGYLEEHEISWTSWDYQGGFGVFEQNGNDLFEHDLNTDLLEAMGFNVPPQSPYVLLPDSVGFPIYQDFIEERVVASSWNEGILDYYSEEGPNIGEFCIKWTQANQFNHIGFDLKPNKDFSQLVTEGYALDFFVRGTTPGLRLDLRFMDTNTDDPEDRPWRMRFALEEPLVNWDREWHRVHIPLANFTEGGAWEGEWFEPEGKFDWQAVDRLEIVAEYSSLGTAQVWFDQIEITKLDNDTTSQISTPLRTDLAETQFSVFPNPLQDEFSIRSSTGAPISYVLLDPLGKTIQAATIPSGSGVPMQQAVPGLYLLQIYRGDGQYLHKKLIKH